jgi:hypothetical protein
VFGARPNAIGAFFGFGRFGGHSTVSCNAIACFDRSLEHAFAAKEGSHQAGFPFTAFSPAIPSPKETEVVIGPLLAILLAALLGFLLFVFVRRRPRDSMTMSPDGNEMTFDTEVVTEPEDWFSFEDEMSGAGSQYQDLMDGETAAIDRMNGFEGDPFDEGLVGF